MDQLGPALNEKLGAALKAQVRAAEAASAVQRLIATAQEELSKGSEIEARVDSLAARGAARLEALWEARRAADEEIAKGRAVQEESDRISRQIEELMGIARVTNPEITRATMADDEAAAAAASSTTAAATSAAGNAVGLASRAALALAHKATELESKSSTAHRAAHHVSRARTRRHLDASTAFCRACRTVQRANRVKRSRRQVAASVGDMRAAADEISELAAASMAAAKELRIEDILEAAKLAQEALRRMKADVEAAALVSRDRTPSIQQACARVVTSSPFTRLRSTAHCLRTPAT